jgi:Na+/H+ antiporter NhaD/arsenite permease-like protein
MVEGFNKTGALQMLGDQLYTWFGNHFLHTSFALLALVGGLSGFLANIPVVAASLVMVKGYLVSAEAVPDVALAAGFVDWPTITLPVFIAMMFGGTLGGNATLIGASANIVGAGICAKEGEKITFMRFLRYGLPIAITQLLMSGLYLVLFNWMSR